ncbi:motility associated factor glycosyltransferase family protein [Ureibacillus sp. 179-F W5.1 NHS]|uniref:motility associated factor glycosyltransferase family protein n=1 Tax=Ureibacillus sp. 179-F W5.1 NHS TaxID=3374297 RepID=UPI00387A6F58
MDENFSNNIRLNDKNLKHYLSETKRDNKIACLVSSGPSLNETKTWIKNVREQLYILCVGSALKVLLKEGIKPDAVIISDPKKNIIQQLEGTNFDGVLFYLSTANYEATSNYSYTRYILFQSGFKKAEEIAKQNNIPLVETGGSVATTGFSTLKFLGFDTIVLFGQDLGFKENKTHATFSTSGRTVHKNENLLKVLSNNGEEIYTTPNLHSYFMWFNTKMKDSTNLKVFNTALNGAKIHKVEFINQDKFYKIVYSYKSE